ncbi:tyramine beta hydroxylase [Lycorma delicatula]|uniref:tyramine beta hydroxylase n=1 Tax=Lycorma delicatula TaxID=130591 RepID=UPI003F518A61
MFNLWFILFTTCLMHVTISIQFDKLPLIQNLKNKRNEKHHEHNMQLQYNNDINKHRQLQNFYQIPLDTSGNINLYWTLDYKLKQVNFEVHAKIKRKQWIAIGFSDYGDLENADYCVLWLNWKGKYKFQDANSDEKGILSTEETQNCKDFQLTWIGNWTIFSYSRKFDTCDDKDYVIEDGTTHIIWAIGNGLLPYGLNGLKITAAKQHGLQRTQLLKNVNAYTYLPPDSWSFQVLADNTKVPNKETTYWCRVVKLPSEFKQKHHIIQFESVIQKGNEPLVHHMELFHCEAPAGKEIPLYDGDCMGKDRPEATQVCKKVIAAWAMGATPFTYPKEAGLPVGGPDYNSYGMLEVHYNNPELKSDWVDSSGVRVHVTDKLRHYDAAVMELGLEYIDKMAIPPKLEHFELTGFCVAECTGISLPQHGITVFGSQLHTHLTGIRVQTKHIRDGYELPELNRDNHYSQHFQEIRQLKRPTRVLPGDALVTTCTYNTMNRDNITLGGFAITDEMCVNYIYYYPKTDLEVCKSSISDQSLASYFKIMNKLEKQKTRDDLGISDNYKAIEWSPLRVEVLDYLYKESPIYMQCNQSNGERYPGDWSNVPTTKILYPLPPKRRNCP